MPTNVLIVRIILFQCSGVCVSVKFSCLFHHSVCSWMICFVWWFLKELDSQHAAEETCSLVNYDKTLVEGLCTKNGFSPTPFISPLPTLTTLLLLNVSRQSVQVSNLSPSSYCYCLSVSLILFSSTCSSLQLLGHVSWTKLFASLSNHFLFIYVLTFPRNPNHFFCRCASGSYQLLRVHIWRNK